MRDFDGILKFNMKLALKFVFTADWLCLGRRMLHCVHHRKNEHLPHPCLKNPEVGKGRMEDLELRGLKLNRRSKRNWSDL